MGPKIVGKLIQNMFLEPFMFGCVIRPGPTCISKFESLNNIS